MENTLPGKAFKAYFHISDSRIIALLPLPRPGRADRVPGGPGPSDRAHGAGSTGQHRADSRPGIGSTPGGLRPGTERPSAPCPLPSYLMYRQIHDFRDPLRESQGRRRRSRPVRLRTRGRGHPVRPARPGRPPGTRRQRSGPFGDRRLRLGRSGHPRARRSRRVSGPAPHLGRLDLGRRLHLGGTRRARRRRDRRRPCQRRTPRLRFHRPRRPQGRTPYREPLLRRPRPAPVRGPLRAHPDRQIRHGRPSPYASIRHHTGAVGPDRGPGAGQRGDQPGRHVPRPGHRRRGPLRPGDRRPVHQTALLHPLRRRLRGPARRRGLRP